MSISGVASSRSSVRLTAPSLEFSSGTMPTSAAPASVARNTSSSVAQGSPVTLVPNCLCIAVSEKVPAGPRKATVSGRSSARQADMISRNTFASAAADSGPCDTPVTLRTTSTSRSVRKTGESTSPLTRPTSAASRARSFRSSTSWASSRSIASRNGASRLSIESAMAAFKVAHEIDQRLHAGDRHRVIYRSAHPAHEPMALQLNESTLGRFGQEDLVEVRVHAAKTARSCVNDRALRREFE